MYCERGENGVDPQVIALLLMALRLGKQRGALSEEMLGP